MNKPRKTSAAALLLGIIGAGGLAYAAFLFFTAFSWKDFFIKNRLAAARKKRGKLVKEMTAGAGLSYPPAHVLIRVYKHERELEVWARGASGTRYRHLVTYPVCSVPGRLGPKRKEGDRQVPEGIYRVQIFNPRSSFHLSLGINYPNRVDLVHADPEHPGGEIFIHGGCASVGCIPIKNGPIEELYLLCLDSKESSGLWPAVHIYPCRMDRSECRKTLEKLVEKGQGAQELWEDFARIHAYFEQNRTLPPITMTPEGRYEISTRTRLEDPRRAAEQGRRAVLGH